MVWAALAVVAVALGWWLLLAPALRTLATAPKQLAEMERQLAQMRQWATESEALRQAPRRPAPADFGSTVQQRVKKTLGDGARVMALPGEARLTVPSVAPNVLLALMQDINDAAQGRVDELLIARNADGTLRAEIKWVPRGTN